MANVHTYKQFIYGQWVESNSKKTIEVINPSNEEVVAQVQDGTIQDAQRNNFV